MGAAAFFPAPPIPFIVLITVLFAGTFLAAAAAFLTMVVPLLKLLDSLAVLALPFPVLVGALGTGAFLPPLPAPVVVVVVGGGAVFFAAPPARVDLALSIMLLMIPEAPVGFTGETAGFKGETGRASCDFPAGVFRVG